MNLTKKAELVQRALNSSGGRVALGQAMREPVKRALEYQAIGRKLLMVDELPAGALARYDLDVASVAYTIPRRGAVPVQYIQSEKLLVDTFEIGTTIDLRISEIKANMYYIVDRAQMKAKEAIQKQEDTEILVAIDAATHGGIPSTSSKLTFDILNDAMPEIEKHDLVVTKVVVNPYQYKDIRGWGKDYFDPATQREALMTGLIGHIMTANVHVSHRVPQGNVYLLGPAETVGAIPVRIDITVLPADNPRQTSVGWVLFEDIGIAVINDYATNKIVLSQS